MELWQQRQGLLLNEKEMERLRKARIAVLGLGGVGGSAAEALVRAGIGHLLIVDHDTVDETNLNRQLLALRSQIGRPKCEVAAERFLSINPALELTQAQQFYLPENRDFVFDFTPDYILDCIDTVTAKLDLIQTAKERGIPLLTCFGTGNRLDPTALRVGDVSETVGCGCPLARIMRRELKKRGIKEQEAVFSTEMPRKVIVPDGENGRHSPGSIAFVPPVAGYLMAAHAVKRLIEPSSCERDA